MKVGVDERGLVIEAIATLAYRKSDMVHFVLNPAGVPQEIYRSLSRQRDDLTGRPMTKRNIAPLILDALEKKGGYADIVLKIVKIAAGWERFELSGGEYEARAVKAKAQGILERHQLFEAEEAARRDAAREEQTREHLLARKQELGLLLAMFDELATREQNAQERGYRLQDLLNRLFGAFEIPVNRSFTRNEGAEQIDGAFQIDGWFYLTECRWRQKLSDTREVDGLAGQISRSGRQTMGLFLLRSFRWGHVRQLDRVSRQLLARAWAAGAGPGDSPLTICIPALISLHYHRSPQPPVLYYCHCRFALS